jgi:hypothetical protein
MFAMQIWHRSMERLALAAIFAVHLGDRADLD